jgi:DNA-directed RNA polymerase specialized sigma subunit
MTEHIKTRNKIKAISKIKTFNDLMDAIIISDEDRKIMELHYLQEKDFNYIADIMGYSEITVKKRHAKIIKRIGKIL